MANPSDIAAAALELVGTPYHHQGRLPGVGLDCIGVPIAAARKVGIQVHDFKGYGQLPQPDVLMREIALDCKQVPVETAQTGDILCFKSGAATPTHFGVLIDGERFVHAYNKLDRVSIQQFDPRWYRLLHSVWRIKGVG